MNNFMNPEEEKEVYNEMLICSVRSLEYDFLRHEGRLYLPGYNRCDMRRCLKLFATIDGEVNMIIVYADNTVVVIYIKCNTGWECFSHVDENEE